MLSLSKILLPVDFSERCLGAARYAYALAGIFHSEITLLHVLEPARYEVSPLEFGGTVMTDLVANRRAQAEKQIETFLSQELRDARVKRLLLEGDPAGRIVAYAHDEHFNLIVMPTHGYGPFRRFILGSVTAKVLHDADCPVWTGVHMEEVPDAESIRFRTVMCAVDLGPQSSRTLCWAARAAADLGARLLLAHAIPELETVPGEYFDPEWREHLNKAAAEEIARLQAQSGTQAEVHIERGDAAKAVSAAAERLGADVLAIGRGSAAGVFGRLRTHAYAIIRQSPCPVVSV